jgi:hypothetical protein
MKLLNTAIEALRGLFRNKPSAQPPSSGESAMLDALCNSPYMDHDTVNRLSRLYFNRTIPNGPYRFCAGSPYGLLLHVDSVRAYRNEGGGLEDIVLQLKDITLTHSLRVSISVQEFNEILEPVQLSAQLRPRGDSDCKVTL